MEHTIGVLSQMFQECLLPEGLGFLVHQHLIHNRVQEAPNDFNVRQSLVPKYFKQRPNVSQSSPCGYDLLNLFKSLNEGAPRIGGRTSFSTHDAGGRQRPGESVQVLSKEKLGSGVQREACIQVLSFAGFIAGLQGGYDRDCARSMSIEHFKVRNTVSGEEGTSHRSMLYFC